MAEWPEKERYTAQDVVELVRILRDPENGCPWDKVQTHRSIRRHFLEETCEALEAIDADDAAMLREELGDVLLHVVFHAVIEEERGRFSFDDVCGEICEKMVFRHPNIFGPHSVADHGINDWEALKNKEKGRRTLQDELDTVPATLPALMRAQKLQKRAAAHGLGTLDAAQAGRELCEAQARWQAAAGEDAAAAERAAGELLLAAVNSMRLAGVDAEQALTFAAKAFRDGLLQGQQNTDGVQAQAAASAPIDNKQD